VPPFGKPVLENFLAGAACGLLHKFKGSRIVRASPARRP
jgi:hypothetical protein